MVPHRVPPRVALALLMATLATLAAPSSTAAPAPPRLAPPPAGWEHVQGYCGRQNFVCQRRFGQGDRYRSCMARRGCAVGGGGGGSQGGNRCESRARFCGRRFQNGSPQFNRCLRRGGC